MNIFEHKGNKYLNLKEHQFQILNAISLSYGDNSIIYIQCTTNSSSGILKEYTPDGWALVKKKYNGQMIFTLYKKSYFNYQSKSNSLGKIVFLAPSDDGAKYLMYRWLLTNRLELDDTDDNIYIAKKQLDTNRYGSPVESLSKSLKNQTIAGVSINLNNYMMEGILRNIKENVLENA